MESIRGDLQLASGIDELFNRLVDRRLGSTSAAAWGEFFPPVETYTKDGQYIVTHILESGSVSRLRESPDRRVSCCEKSVPISL
jgi:hypothetical protein